MDVFVALRNDRPYRRSYPPNEATEYLLGAGNKLFDYEVISAFIKTVAIYSIGNIVLLNNGIYGMVIDNITTSQYIGRPVIKTLYDQNFSEVFSEIIDLSLHPTLFIKKVME